MSYTTIIYETDGAVARVTLNRPDVLNAITAEMSEELLDALERVKDPNVRAVLLTGAGRAFSAGADLGANWDPAEPVDLLPGFERLWNPLIVGFRALPKPIVSAVNGAAVGYAAAMALSADVILASEKGFFMTAVASAGIMPDGGLTALLPASLGLGRTASMVFLGQRLTAADAHAYGLVAEVCAPEALEARSRAIAAQLAAGPTRTFAATKQALNAFAYPRLAEQLDLEAQLQQRLTETHDYMEGTAAFKDRRPPAFTGT
jgi:2-(1,2-epoxy-1,2-dihydrophenyl)acetyl-CoA isomerase